MKNSTNSKNEKMNSVINGIKLTKNIEDADAGSDLNDLAQELAFNYFSSSFGDDENNEVRVEDIIKNDDYKEFKKRLNSGERVRNILIIGAGASHDFLKSIPLGNGLIEEMERAYEIEIKTIPFLKDKFKQEADEIKDITGKDLNFENYLYLLSKFFVCQQELREKIKSMTGFRYYVSLFNEVVAHMLKHALLDVVINFNFEETLDQSIEEEIGLKNYHNIVSDGHCVELEKILVNGRLKMPIYIKPHGTFSHKSTLRFTNRHYFDLPNDIKKMLEDLISGKRGKKEIQQVNLIVVGFALDSIEFNKILNEKLPAKSVIYHIDYKTLGDKKDKYFEKTLIDFKERAEKINRTISDFYIPIKLENFTQNKINKSPESHILNNSLTTTLGELFSVLWRMSHNYFTSLYLPRSIARHEIINYLFYEPQFGLNNLRKNEITHEERINERKLIIENTEEHPKHFRNRVLVELALTINRNNGIVDIAELLKERVGFYYTQFRNACEKFPKKIKKVESIYELINEFAENKEKSNETLNTKEYAKGKNIFILQTLFKKPLIKDQQLSEEISADLEKSKMSDKINKLMTEFGNHFSGISVPVYYKMTKKEFDNRIELFRKILETWKDIALWTAKDNVLKYDIAITLIHRLLTSDLLSNNFKFNFLLNFDKSVHNGKIYSRDIDGYDETFMFQELIRLFSKSVNHHYYVINSAPNDPIHFLWKSFAKNKLVHTNLKMNYEFLTLFLFKEWDVYLSVTETASSLNFIKNLNGDEKTELLEKL